MNTTLKYTDLPKVEREVADLYAWGMTQKEIAMKRGRSIFTINNQVRRLAEKTDTHKDTEFCVWYFCTRFDISFNLSPITRILVSIFFLMLISLSLFDNNPLYRPMRVRTVKTEVRSKRNEEWI